MTNKYFRNINIASVNLIERIGINFSVSNYIVLFYLLNSYIVKKVPCIKITIQLNPHLNNRQKIPGLPVNAHHAGFR